MSKIILKKEKNPSTFVFWRYQGGGCDYTIGCGQDLEFFEDSTLEEVLKEIEEDEAIYDCDGDYLRRGVLFQVTAEYDVDFNAMAQQARQELQAQAKAQEEAEERALLAKLKAKYGE